MDAVIYKKLLDVFGTVQTVHHNAATVIGDGVDANIEGYRELALSITGIATKKEVSFWGSVDGNIWVRIAGECSAKDYGTRVGCGFADNCKSIDFLISTDTTQVSELWKFRISGLKKFRAKIDTIIDGNITIVSNAIY